MHSHFVFELVGYAASALIGLSLMMGSVLRLRVINLLGSVTFVVYGFLIQAYPVLVLNSFITVVNLVFLVRLLRVRNYFQLLPVIEDSDYLPYFLNFYHAEIKRILPDFVYQPSPAQLAVFILRDCSPAGVFIAERRSDGVVRVVLDFVIPHYRDLKIGRFLFVEQAEYFRRQGVKEIVISPRTREFGAYLAKVGFEPDLQTGGLHIRYAGETE